MKLIKLLICNKKLENHEKIKHNKKNMKILEFLKQGIFYLPRLIKGKTMKTNNNIEDLEKGTGKIIEEDGKKIAAYKNEEGEIIKLSAVCTHMGCIVTWDIENKNWLCPCHKSQFDIEGKVLNGPAKRDLEKIN